MIRQNEARCRCSCKRPTADCSATKVNKNTLQGNVGFLLTVDDGNRKCDCMIASKTKHENVVREQAHIY